MPTRPEKQGISRIRDKVPPRWHRDFSIEPLRDRIITLLCGTGVTIPLGRSYAEGSLPWDWPGDRWAVIILFLAVGILSVTLTSED